MNDNSSAQQAVEKMLQIDYFSQWLGIEVIEIKQGYSKIKMTIRKEMLNGFGIAHGGIAFSFADSALAFASNTLENKAVSIDASISLIKPLYENDLVIAEAEQKSFNKRIQVYEVMIKKEDGELMALFKGSVYKK